MIIGPGDFYTNTAANFVVQGVGEALKQSSAKKIFITNLMTKYGDTYGYTLQTFLQELDQYYGLDGLDVVLVNSNTQYPPEALALYQETQSVPVQDDVAEVSIRASNYSGRPVWW